jgi:glycosyltransferase involved in cell wall biosynthesis
MKNKILLLVPAVTASGGIKNYFEVLRDEFSIPVEYMIRGARKWPYRESFFKEIRRAYFDLKQFKRRIAKKDINLVQTSTSLGTFSIVRDGLFIYYAKKKGIKTIVFFRGWDLNYERKIDKYFFWIFKFFFFRTDCAIVLASGFKDKLASWGYRKEIYIESTILDERLMSGLTFESLEHNREKRKSENSFNILFLARIERTKGIYESIDAFQIVVNNNPDLNLSLSIAGDGKEQEIVKQYVVEKKLPKVTFLGHVAEERKKEAFINADLYLFPTYSEGMPNSVLEAMGFGLPIISRKVGAIKDIIIDGKNGYTTNSKDPKEFANFIQLIIDNYDEALNISKCNYQVAHEKFATSKVKERIENIYSKILCNN